MTSELQSAGQRNVREDLTWFNSNLNDQIDDLELEAKNVQLSLYWDASEVRRAILGCLYFFDPVKFDRAQFDDSRTMVACLASQKWLGSIRMLEPHQAEFAKALRQNFYRSSAWLTSEQLREFFGEVALPDSEDFSLSRLGSRTNQQRQKLIAAYAGEAGRLFKAVQCAKGSWRNRLATMYTGEILHFEQSSGIDYASIFSSGDFQLLRQALNDIRKDKADNNIADAVCLCLLIQQVSNFRENNSRVLPRFFETTATFRNALKSADLMASVSYFDQENIPKTIFRGSDYFLFRAAFNVRDDERAHSPFANVSLDSLRDLRRRIAGILDAAKPLKSEELDDISVNGRPITSVIDDLKHMWILERIWLPFIASDELKSLDEEERARLEGFRPDEAITTFVDAAIEKVTRALNDNVAQYNHFSKLYSGIGDHASKVRKRYSKVSPERERLYEISAVSRFGIPDRYVPEIQELLVGLTLGADDDGSSKAAQLAKLCIAAKTDKKARTTAIAVLWAIGFHSAVLEFPSSSREEFWLIAISASSAIELGRASEARVAIRELEMRFTSSPQLIGPSALAISISYLYYHLWRLEGGYCKWKPDRRINALRSEAELQQIVDDAIRYAQIAHENTAEAPTGTRLYAINLLLFYVTEAGNDLQFLMARRLVDELAPWRSEPSVWQYRYDDTLARYYHRRLLDVKDSLTRQKFKRAHAMYLQYASEASPDDPAVSAYLGVASHTEFDD